MESLQQLDMYLIFGKSGTKEEVLQEFELDIASIILKIKDNL